MGNPWLKGQSSEPIFWVEYKNWSVIGPFLDIPNIFDFGLVFAEIFVFENRLPAIVYYGELMLFVSFITQSRNSPSRLLRGVANNYSLQKTLRIVYYAESWLPASFTTRSRSSSVLLIAGSQSSAYRFLRGSGPDPDLKLFGLKDPDLDPNY